ncbi:MAG: hypothetical protein MJ142_07965 [Clostridia bacterium]|nr:hypothetical protein [Clostridia bacterium]
MNPEKKTWIPGEKTMKFAEMYQTESYVDEHGRKKARLRYTGPWTVPLDTGGTALVRIRACGICTWLILAVLIALQLFRHASSGCWYTAVPLLTALFPGAYGALGSIDLPWRLKPLTQDRYMHSVIRICRSSLAVLILTGVTALICEPVYRIVSGDWIFLREDILFLILCVTAAGLAFGEIRVLRGMEFHDVPNERYRD